MEAEYIDDDVDCNYSDNVDLINDNYENENNKINDDTNGNKHDEDFVPSEYFVIPEKENIDDILLKRFDELGIMVKYHYKSIGVYCVTIEDLKSLEELKSLDYITMEQVRKVRALDSED